MQSRNGSDAVTKVKGAVKLQEIERSLPAGKQVSGASPVAAGGVKLPSAMDTQPATSNGQPNQQASVFPAQSPWF